MRTSFFITGLAFFLWANLLSAQKGYFQQKISVKIEVRLDDSTHFLHGNEELVYQNNSPDHLTELYIHLWPNAYRDRNTGFAKQKISDGSIRFHFADNATRGYIDSLAFEIGGEKLPWTFWEGNPDVAVIPLPQPLAPGESLTLTTPFRVKIPASFSRLGHVRKQYQLTQWFPKPAVYDQNGWNPIYYLDQGEFYSEYGSFDVEITVPGDYVVGATGDLPQNDPEWKWLEKREKWSRSALFSTAKEGNVKPKFPRDRNGTWKTLHFHQEKVHDFAWFCDKDYYLLSDTVELASGKNVRVVSMFNHRDRDSWKNSTEFLKNSVYYYSLWVGDYPYNHATAVDGALSAGAGMEYPNITVLAGRDSESLDEVIAHEVGHNWFYGILGSNERRHPWLDEGINSFYENRYWIETRGDSLKPGMFGLPGFATKGISHSLLQRFGYLLNAGENVDQPIEGHSEDYSQLNYGTVVYMKTARAFRFLEEYLGRETFDNCMHAYFDRWKFNHPRPEDLEAIFEEVSQQDLDWFFKSLVSGKEKIDFKASAYGKGKLTVKNNSGIPLPVTVGFFDKDGNHVSTRQLPVFEGKTTLNIDEDFHHALVNPNQFLPEVQMQNNRMRARGLARKARPLKFRFLYSLPSEKEYTVHYLPALGYNTTDGFMLGGLLNHNFFPSQRFSWHLMPLYGFKNKNLAGSAGMTLRFLPRKTFRKIEFHSRTSLFANVLRTRNFLEFYFQPKTYVNPPKSKLTLNLFHLGFREEGEYRFPGYQKPIFGQATYQWGHSNTFRYLGFQLEGGGNASANSYRGSFTGTYTQRYLKWYWIKSRVFAGGLVGDKAAPWLLQYRLSGSNDPFAQGIFLDRWDNTGWLNQQTVRDHGGFRSLTGVSYDNWMVAGNFSLQVPIRPLRFLLLFADVGYGERFSPPESGLYYDAGIGINALDGFLNINFPVVGTVYGGTPSNFADFANQINFQLDFARVRELLPF